jgi:hypothetical protein
VNPITKIPLAVQEGTEEEEFIDAEEQISVTMTKMPDPYGGMHLSSTMIGLKIKSIY